MDDIVPPSLIIIIIIGITKEEMSQPAFSGINALNFPELHEESIPELAFFRACSKMMQVSMDALSAAVVSHDANSSFFLLTDVTIHTKPKFPYITHEWCDSVYLLIIRCYPPYYPHYDKVCGVHDFTMKDVLTPDPKRVRRHLSAIINFAKFREERLVMYSELAVKVNK